MTAVVAVIPAGERSRRARLFDALERALDVRLEGRDPGALDGVRAAVVLGGGEPPAGLPTLRFAPGDGTVPGALELAPSDRLARPLRGAMIAEHSPSAVLGHAGGEVLATRDGRPVWTASGEAETAAAAPHELAAGEVLRDALTGGRAVALLPLVHFLRRVADAGWAPPPLRAAFLFDDPNLHWPTYGYVSYGRLVEHADEHGYHAAMAMVPADAWFAHPRAIRLFRARRDRLSLLVHGNDHVRRELAATNRDLVAALAQARRRIARFERRTGVRVAPVMAPPHGACGEPAIPALLRTGFEALCITRPYPWRKRPPAEALLAGWRPADLVAGGLPVLPRLPLRSAAGEIALRAFLGHPLILFGHHNDLADGLAPLERLAAAVGALGDVDWLPLDDLVRANVESRLAGDVLEVRLHARRAVIEVPEGVSALRVLVVEPHGEPVPETLTVGAETGVLPPHAGAGWREAEPLPVSPGRVEVALGRPDAVDWTAAAAVRWRPHARARRVLAEGRDRLLPLVDSIRGGGRRVPQ